MPGYLRALVVILALSVAVAYLARGAFTAYAIAPQDYRRRVGVWFTLTLLLFLAHNYWLFVLVGYTVVYLAAKKDERPFSLYLSLLLCIPAYEVNIGGLGVATLVELHHYRWLSLIILLPALLKLRARPDTVKFGGMSSDLLVVGYLALWLALQVPTASFTIMMRLTTYAALDVLLPYYVASRALRTLPDFRDAIGSLVLGLLFAAPVAIFESVRWWLLYERVDLALGLPLWGWGTFTVRGDSQLLRATVTAGHPIVFGFCMAVGIGLANYMRPLMPKPLHWWALLIALVGGIVATVSRGPWVGAGVMMLLFLLTGPRLSSNLAKLGLGTLLALPVLIGTQQGQKMLSYLPFVGTVESGTIEYRQLLFDVSMRVLSYFPWFGAVNYLDHPEMQQMRGADGLIDMVNSYLAIALSTGFVGLTLFAAPFVAVLGGLLAIVTSARDRGAESQVLARALLTTLFGVLVTIATVSSVLVVPYLYWSLLGISAGFVRSARQGHLVVHRPQAPVRPQVATPAMPRRPRGRPRSHPL